MLRIKRNAIAIFTAAVMVSGAFLLPFAARAATVNGFSDALTRHQVSVASDHTILFVTPTGVQTSTDTITIDFASSASPTFSFGSLSFDDIDFAVDTTGDTTDCSGPFTDKTLAATPAAGVWGAATSSNVITLTPPTDAAAGEVPAGDCVQIQIGTNATAGTAGDDQIVNPSAVGQYALSIGGAFGDTGIAYLLTNDADQVTITATVPSSGGGGGGEPPPTPPPTISSINVISITETTATVTWVTDVASNSTVEYGTTISYGSTSSDGGSVFAHSVDLAGLTPGTEYHFRVKSLGAGGESTSSDNTFTTLDSTAPVISNIVVTSITGTTATVTWDTDEDATSFVGYDTDGEPYALSEEDLSLTNSHSVALTGLSPDTTYFFKVTSEDASANSATSVEQSFTTADTVPPTISSIAAINITESDATITWSTNELADSKVVYGLDATYGSQVTEAPLIANHSIDLSLLDSGTEYHFAVVSVDAAGNSATSTDQTFTTLADTTPPANVTGLTATAGDQLVDLAWTNPGDTDFAGVLIKRKTTSSPTGPTDGTTVYDGTDETFQDTGLTNGTTYFYAVFAYDASGNFASGALDDATPFDLVPPPAPTGFGAVPGDEQIQLSWTNPVVPDFASVQIQRSTTSFPASVSEGATVFAGTGTNFLDTLLTNGTTYFYSIFAYDTSGNVSGPASVSGTPVAPGPVCGNAVCEPGEDTASCAIDCPLVPVCGDGTCNGTETNDTCPADCPLVPTAVCGNGVCEAGEDSLSCEADCPVTPSVVCGDGVCEGSEDFNNCAADCPAPPVSVCGNDICEAGETAENCSQDCADVAAPVQGFIEFADINAYVMNGTIALIRGEGQVFRTLPDRTLNIVLQGVGVEEEISGVFLNFNGDEFIMRAGEQGTTGWIETPSFISRVFDLFRIPSVSAQAANDDFSASVAIPSGAGTYLATVTANFTNGTSSSVDFTIDAVGYGRAVERVDGSDVAVDGANITLQVRNGGDWVTWNATPFFQINPTTTSADGLYGFMVPDAEYRVLATKTDFRDITTAPITGTNVINNRIVFIRKPKPITEVIVPGAPVTENIANVTRNIVEQSTYFTSIVQEEVIEDPRVKQAATSIVVPAAAVITTTVVASSVQAISFLSYLYFLLTQPILLIGRRKRKEYGTVFNALSKLPVDLAIVRLFRKNGKLVRTMVTDKQGRYAFLADPGEYRIEVSKKGFTFPTVFMKDVKEGVKYLDIYHGEIIAVSEKGATIAANIPVDPIEEVRTGKSLVVRRILRKLQDMMGIFSVIITGIAYALYRFPWLLVVFVFQLGMYFVFRRISRPKRPKNWGIVYDEETKKPVPYAVTRIVESEYNKVLESQVTDRKGRYNFLVGNNTYYVSVEKPGYEEVKTQPIDLKNAKAGEAVIAEDIGITKTASEKLKEAAETGMSEEERKAYEKRAEEDAKRAKEAAKTKAAETKKIGTEKSDENELKALYREKTGSESEHKPEVQPKLPTSTMTPPEEKKDKGYTDASELERLFREKSEKKKPEDGKK